MEYPLALTRYSHALGRWQAAWRFASPELKRAVSLAQISAAWDVFRCDAGPGAVGPAHEERVGRTSITCTDDPRRDGMLLWLADHGAPAIAEAAALLARMVCASRRFSAEEQKLLQAARDALGGSARPGPLGCLLPAQTDDADDHLAPLCTIAAVVDELRVEVAFLESSGSEVRHSLPNGNIRQHVPAQPGGAWALDLALLASGTNLADALIVPGLARRALFRTDVDPQELVAALIDGSTHALEAAYIRVETMCAELDRGHVALAHLSRNARASDAWRLIAALGTISRMQLAQALKMSRAGADIQAHALAKAGLVSLGSGGRIEWQRQRRAQRAPERFEEAPLRLAVDEFDASIADLDRLLTRTAG